MFLDLTNALDGRRAHVRASRVQAVIETEDGGSHLLLTAGVSVVVKESPGDVVDRMSRPADD